MWTQGAEVRPALPIPTAHCKGDLLRPFVRRYFVEAGDVSLIGMCGHPQGVLALKPNHPSVVSAAARSGLIGHWWLTPCSGRRRASAASITSRRCIQGSEFWMRRTGPVRGSQGARMAVG